MSHGNQLKNDGFKAVGVSVEHARRKAVEAVLDTGNELLAEIEDGKIGGRTGSRCFNRFDLALLALATVFRGGP